MTSLLFQLLLLFACNSTTPTSPSSILEVSGAKSVTSDANVQVTEFDSSFKTIHMFVALCDNKYQGIVPVPEKIGNGQDPDRNLYWGCGYGVRTFFKKSAEWKLVRTSKVDTVILERLVFKHATKNFYLVADAYDGRYIKNCTEEFIRSSSGLMKDTIHVNKKIIGIHSNAGLLTYTGHDGLMEFRLDDKYVNTDGVKRSTIILACYSKAYFSQYLEKSNINPLVWSTGLMSPEAYTSHDAISAYVAGESNEAIRTRAAKAYSTYQKCGEKAARNLLVTGWD